MARPANRYPVANRKKIYNVWVKVRHHHPSWKEFSDFVGCVGDPPSKDHVFRPRHPRYTLDPKNFIWLGPEEKLPLGTKGWPKNTKPAGLSKTGAHINGLVFGAYFGDGLYHAVCGGCKTPQVAYPTSHAFCPVCEAARHLAEALEEARDRAEAELDAPKPKRDPKQENLLRANAKTARVYYAQKQLKLPARHGTRQNYEEYIRKLEEINNPETFKTFNTIKQEREDYILQRWEKLKRS